MVTGITGFAAGHLAEHLLAEGDELLGLARTDAWPARPPSPSLERVPLVGCDLNQLNDSAAARSRLAAALADFAPEAVYHLAAISLPSQCGADEPTAAALAVNVQATRCLAELATALRRPPRLLLVSSSHVYGAVAFDRPRVDETTPTSPSRGYGKSKLLAEQAAQAVAAASGLELIIARSFQHTGPRQRPPLMLAEWIAQFVAGGSGPVEIYNRDTWIDLTDVRDVVRAYRLLVLRAEPGTVYNVGSGRPCRTGDVFELLRQQADPRGSRTIVERQPGPRHDPIANIERLCQATGWQPRIRLEQTVADAWQWATAGVFPPR